MESNRERPRTVKIGPGIQKVGESIRDVTTRTVHDREKQMARSSLCVLGRDSASSLCNSAGKALYGGERSVAIQEM